MANKPDPIDVFPNPPAFQPAGTFQPIYGKFDLTTYIQGASDYEIMAYLVGQYNIWVGQYNVVTEWATTAIEACRQLQDWVNNYFDELDVQQEINNKLDAMIASGQFETIFQETFGPIIVAKFNKMQSDLSNSLDGQFDTLETQLKNEQNATLGQIPSIATNTTTKWLQNNITEDPTVVLDKSLSIDGAAADAKAAGDYLFKSYPEDYRTTIDTVDTFKYGTYPVTTASVQNIANTLGYTESELGFYYWSIRCYSPASGNSSHKTVADYCMELWGYRHGASGIVLKFMRYSETIGSTRSWSPWKECAVYKDDNSGIVPKKIAAIGDSFTKDTSVNNYSDYLNLLPQYDIDNLGVSGSTAGTWFDAHKNEITDKYDTFFIAFGLNGDAGGLGNIDDTKTNTFYGGYNNILQKIYSVNPTARIILWCMDAWYTVEKSNAVKAIADKYACEYYSMKADKNIPVRIDGKFAGVWPELSQTYVDARTAAFAKSAANHHPISEGNKLLANYLTTIL